MRREFQYGAYRYTYDLVFESRKTLSLTVAPDQSITLRSPKDADLQRIEHFLAKKWHWLDKQLRMFERYHKKHYAKSFVSGESLMYLGKQYELIVAPGDKDSVSLSRGKIRVVTSMGRAQSAYTKMLVDAWYRARRNVIFSELYTKTLAYFDYQEPPKMIIKEMTKRWGSYTNAGNIVINPRLIEADKRAIEYVMTHELCHVEVKNHGQKFQELIDKKIPDWREIKDRLELRHG